MFGLAIINKYKPLASPRLLASGGIVALSGKYKYFILQGLRNLRLVKLK